MAGTAIPSLRGTPMHVTAVELYQGHHSDRAGSCVRCGRRAPCPVRLHAASVIAAVGEDPRWYDGRLNPAPTPTPGSRSALPEVSYTQPGHSGYAVGGRGDRMSGEGVVYKREPER